MIDNSNITVQIKCYSYFLVVNDSYYRIIYVHVIEFFTLFYLKKKQFIILVSIRYQSKVYPNFILHI